MYELAIIGAGGFGREVMSYVNESQLNGLFPYTFYADDKYAKSPIRPLSQLDEYRSLAVVAIGNPNARAEVVARLRHGQGFTSVIHRTAIIGPRVNIGKGAVLAPYAVVTVDCEIGNHFHANLHSDVGHDCLIGHFVTLSPSARVSGNCTIGNRVYIGSNAVIREGVKICDDVTIGAGAVVLSDITEAGVYVGVPAKRKA